jgi:ribosomal protein S18 acetylase RimI-like enzyme
VIEPVEIRPYRPTDYDAISDICVQTAEEGGDARGLYSSDELMPDIFARPYVAFAPDLAFVVDDGAVSGYIVGVADTRAFVDWYSREWLPDFGTKYTHVEPWDDKNGMITHLGFWPERMLIPEVDDYPAHLHIDVLPHLQGRGLGRQLIAALSDALRARGVAGLHLTMDPNNVEARKFYDRLGFVELPSSTADAPVLGLRL